MGCVASSAEDRYNQKIQREQAEAAKAETRTMKLLLLGTGDSGKTTLRKQMRCLYGEGFPLQTRKQIASVVLGNLIDGTKDVIAALPGLGLSFPAELQESASAVNEVTAPPPCLSGELAEHLTKLINSDPFKDAVTRRREFQLQDCWLEFSKELVTVTGWGREGWVPSTEDCVSVRVRTSGIVEEKFVIDRITFNVFDVGGQRAERRKWIHSFDNVTAVIFVTAISEYDQVLFEDRSKNRFDEALGLFEEICNSRWFANVPIMLFLNKKDLFEKKFLEQKVPLNVSGLFPTAPEQNTDVKAAIDWITAQFLKKKKIASKDVYTHVTTATDPGNVRAVFDLCRSVILKRNLVSSGFIVPK
jgi:GTPase SAR1 family protein